MNGIHKRIFQFHDEGYGDTPICYILADTKNRAFELLKEAQREGGLLADREFTNPYAVEITSFIEKAAILATHCL